jgi:hypothetical protein
VLPEFDRRYLHRTARNLAAALGALHARGYVVGDVNESNILVTPSALVTLIDTDSFQVHEYGSAGEIIHTCPVARLEYTPPELQGKSLHNAERSPEQDAFGLGVLIFQLLMEGNHPFRARWLGKEEPPPLEERIRQGYFPYHHAIRSPVAPPPKTPELNELHPVIAALVVRCFTEGHHRPTQRPTPEQWERAVAEAEKSLIPCREGHYYSNHLSECPVCKRHASGLQVPLPPVSQPQSTGQRSPTPSSAGTAKPLSSPSVSSTAPAVRPASAQPAPIKLRNPSSQAVFPRRSRWMSGSRSYRRSYQSIRQRLLDSYLHGILWGAGMGALAGSLAAIFTWIISQDLRWSPLVTLGLVVGAAWRSLQIGQGFSRWVYFTLGWESMLKASFILILTITGGYIGWLINPAFLAVGIGGFMGGFSGWLLGDAIYNRNPHIPWDWITAVVVMAAFGGLAYLGGEWLGSTSFGKGSGRLISSLAGWADGQQISRFWISAFVGALGGGLGGILSGGLTEVLAELLHFRP